MFWLPDSCTVGRARSTGHVDVTLAAAAVASESVAINEVLIVAVQGSREIAGLPRSGRDWGRAKRPWARDIGVPAQSSKMTNWLKIFFLSG